MSQEFGAAVRQLNQAMLPQVICILPNNLYLCILSTMTCVSEIYLILSYLILSLRFNINWKGLFFFSSNLFLLLLVLRRIYPDDIFSRYPPLAAKDWKGKVDCPVTKCGRCSCTPDRKCVDDSATQKNTGHDALRFGIMGGDNVVKIACH